ncbi:MAG: choice-of-anchor D domain-containing protein [Acidobacteria bacterium]|nr:choice-of-anchor D domain-containing protein [Acidobacteriota bacterium]
MTGRALACLLAGPLCVLAQLRLYVREGSAERLIAGTCDLGKVETGARRELGLRVRNSGLAAVRLEALSVAGVGFAVLSNVQLPRALEAGAALDFAVWFQPRAPGDYSAVLSVNTQSFLLRAVAAPGPVVWLEQGDRREALDSETPVGFSGVEQGTAGRRRFWIENPHSVGLEAAVSVQGASFRGPVGLASPVALGPGESATFEVVFEPSQAGAQTGLLEVNQRAFRLQGTGVAPPFPRPSILLDPPEAASGRNVRIVIRLDSTARAGGSGEARISFEPALPHLPDDPAIGFSAGASRRAAFAVAAGQDIGLFNQLQEIGLQTGTTAGRITITALLGEHREQAILDIRPLTVVIDSLKATRGSFNLEVSVSGFDNTRSVGQVAFSFFDTAGQILAPGRIAIDAAGEFRRYFESSSLGGVFALRAGFPVTGEVSAVAAVEVEITNSAGVTRSERVALRP